MKTRTRIAAAGSILVAAAAMFAATGFDAAPVTVSPKQTTKINSGILDIAVRNGNTEWRQNLKALAPGDSHIAHIALINVGDAPLGHLKIHADGRGKIVSGPTPAQVSLRACTVPFRNDTCPKPPVNLTDNIVGSTAETDIHLEQGERLYLRVVTSLPKAADNTYQGATGVLDYDFTGTQATQQEAPKPRSQG